MQASSLLPRPWQAGSLHHKGHILIEHLLAALNHPEMLDDFDMIGEPLRNEIDMLERERLIYARQTHDLSKPDMPVDERVAIRQNIDRLGIDPSWAVRVNPDYLGPMPFDEPTLAIVGMWSLGGGPGPTVNCFLALLLRRRDRHSQGSSLAD